MHPLSDKDLDRLGRDAADQYDVDQSPSAWEHLEKRLDKELPLQKERDKRRFLWIFFLFLALSGSGLIWMLAGNKPKAETISVNIPSVDNVEAPDVKPSGDATVPGEKINENAKKEKTPTDVSENIEPSTTTASVNPKNNSSINKDNVSLNKDRNKSAKTAANNQKKNTRLTAKDRETADVPANKESDPVSKKTNRQVPAKKDDITNPGAIAASPATTNPDVQNKSDVNTNKTNAQSINKDPEPNGAVTTTTKPATSSSQKKKSGAKESQKNGLAFSLVTGIDRSSIQGTADSRFGYNLGAQVTYNLSKRWSVSTGFIFTKKFYSAEGKDFHPPKHYWTNYVKLNSLEGSCKMWDIPLNVRYNITTKPSNTWFVSSGLSSYIMREQSYTYDYIYNNTPTKRDWTTTSQKNEWFKILNVSAGYERALSKSWSIQAEPFIKVPLSGVGFGDMDISSYGILVGIKYKPVFSKNKTTPAGKIP